MRNLLRHIGLAVVSVITLYAQEPVRSWQIGFMAGLNLPAYRSNQKIDRAIVLPGFSGGAGFRYSPTPKLALNTAIIFSQRNSAYIYTESSIGDTTVGAFRDTFITHIRQEGRLEVAHLEVPILIEWSFLHTDQYCSYFAAGFQAGYQLFYRHYGDIQVSLEGLDFLPLFGFSPQTRVIVANGPIERQSIQLSRGDFGLCIGGGNRFRMKKHWMSFDFRYYHGLIDIFRKPAETRFHNGGLAFLIGYWL